MVGAGVALPRKARGAGGCPVPVGRPKQISWNCCACGRGRGWLWIREPDEPAVASVQQHHVPGERRRRPERASRLHRVGPRTHRDPPRAPQDLSAAVVADKAGVGRAPPRSLDHVTPPHAARVPVARPVLPILPHDRPLAPVAQVEVAPLAHPPPSREDPQRVVAGPARVDRRHVLEARAPCRRSPVGRRGGFRIDARRKRIVHAASARAARRMALRRGAGPAPGGGGGDHGGRGDHQDGSHQDQAPSPHVARLRPVGHVRKRGSDR